MKLFTSLIACFAIIISGGCAKSQLSPPTVKPATLTDKAGIEVINTTLEQIVAGGQRYVGKTVRLQATVSLNRLNELLRIQEDIDPELVKDYWGAMTLATNNRDVTFWIVGDAAGEGLFPSNLEKYKDHQTYTFTLYIESIVRDKGRVEITSGIADD